LYYRGMNPFYPASHKINKRILMNYRSIVIFLIISAGTGRFAYAQEMFGNPGDPEVYKKIENYSSKRKITDLIHDFLLRPVTSTTAPAKENSGNQQIESYAGFEGKIIRNITVLTYDPFGYSLYDSAAHPKSLLEKSGNALHMKTLQFAVRNQLLIHKNDRFDSLLVKESKRLIRSQSYIHDVSVTATPTSEKSDSVDVYVRTIDLWSIIPEFGLDNTTSTFRISDKNLGGSGQTFSDTYKQNFVNGNNANSAYYYIPNIDNTYINARLTYAFDENRNYIKSLNVERPFYSPVARWAGGIQVSQQKQPGWIYKNDTTRLFLTSKFNVQDYWTAAAWQIFNGHTTTDRSTKLILSGRIFNIRYLETPVEQPELKDYYTSERFYLAGLGISSRNYVEQSYIFRFGTTEDVPVGIKYGIVGGYRLKNNERWYLGVYHSWGNFYKWGYFGTNVQYGTFFNSSATNEGVFSAGFNYFSPLFSIGRWKFRQFVKPELTLGIDRASYDRLTLNDGYGINGFNSGELSGTRRLMFIIQTQSYAPWNLLGFRFGPYMNFSFGMLGNEVSGFSHNRMYPQFGFGVLIRNDYLVAKNIQLSFAYYPSIPGQGENVFKGNPFRTTDFGFRDFIIGKPAIVEFR